MKIELKKIIINERLSEETTCFTADIYIDDVLAGIVSNPGHGGENMIRPMNKFGAVLVQGAISYAKRLPPEIFEGRELRMNLDLYISKLIDDVFNTKEQKALETRLKRDCLKSLCYGNLTKGYRMFHWPGMTLEQVMKHPQGRGALIKAISNIKAQLKEGETILNTNLGDLLK